MKTKFTLILGMLGMFLLPKAQQAVPNGGLETWTSISTPTSWTTLEDMIPPIAGVGLSHVDSVDKVEGNTSIKLVSQYVALASDTVPGILSIGTGAFGGGSPQFFGTPFTSKPDTLFFSYKYEPVGNDTAYGQIQLHKTGGYILQGGLPLTTTGGQWMSVAVPLTSQYSDHASPCDTLLLRFQSTVHGGGGGGSKARIGSTLHIDAIRFGYVAQQGGGALEAYTMGHDPLGSHNFNLYGALNTAGDAGAFNFVYSTDSTFATSTSTAVQNKTNNQLEVVWATVNGLTANATYYYYLTATTTGGPVSGEIMHFYSDTIPFLFENAGADVYGNFAQLNGRLNGFTTTSDLSFEYGESPGALDSVVASDYATVSDANAHFCRAYLNNLPSDKLFFYHFKAASTTDTLYSDIRGFYTGSPYQILQALPATNVTSTSADLHGSVQGFPVPIKINSGIDDNNSNYHFHSIAQYHDATGSLINYTYSASGLQPNTYYGTRLKVDTWIGNFYGDSALTTLSTAIAEASNPFNGIMVSPNPTTKYLNVGLANEINAETMVQLIDINGQLIKQSLITTSQNKTVFDVSDLESGLYMLHLVSGNVVYNTKITIVK